MGRALQIWATHAFAAFGVVALLLQSYQAVWDKPAFPGYGATVSAVVALGSLLYGLVRARVGTVCRVFDHPRFRVVVMPGDMFDQDDAHLVVGFTDVFDTDVAGNRIVHGRSVQAQFLQQMYGDDVAHLDADLKVALAPEPVLASISRDEKPYGKLDRYPIGTVAVLGAPRRLFFCVAYSTMSPSLVAASSTDALWQSLSRLWKAVHERGQRQPLAMPVVGAALARVNALDREALLRLILLSFVAASRERVLTTELRIVLPPAEYAQVDQRELQAFLESL
ncbi:macro domain-containing protein [Krasilnikovia sp. MM14-A1259]|uniref:macro domain-containing protein n=1 Tax=Krasilnikovia sp. MM14-A1259 TaxID=3373539 RepID=UPI003812F291